MNQQMHLGIRGWRSSIVVLLSSSFAVWGCGGSTYGVGSVGDGGPSGASTGSTAGKGPTGGSNSGSGVVTCYDDACDASSTSGFAGYGDAGGSSTVGYYADGGATGTSSAPDAGSACKLGTISCSGGATAYACTAGASPDMQEPGLSCSSGSIGSDGVDYCCYPWPAGTNDCAPLDDFPCSDGSYAYQCIPGTTPPAVYSSLTCGTSFPDSNGNNDFCCVLE